MNIFSTEAFLDNLYENHIHQYEGLKPHREGWRWQFVYNLGSNWYQTNMNINIKVKYIYNHNQIFPKLVD